MAVTLDLFSRCIVEWSVQSTMTSQLVADALMMAVWRRGRPQDLLSTPALPTWAAASRCAPPTHGQEMHSFAEFLTIYDETQLHANDTTEWRPASASYSLLAGRGTAVGAQCLRHNRAQP